MREHINAEGRFQSDKYPTCPAGKVPLSTRDVTAQDLLWEYAQRRRAVDPEFSDDLETCLRADGYNPVKTVSREIVTKTAHRLINYIDGKLKESPTFERKDIERILLEELFV